MGSGTGLANKPREVAQANRSPDGNEGSTGRLAVLLVAATVIVASAGVVRAAEVLTSERAAVAHSAVIVSMPAGRLEAGPLSVKAQPRPQDMIGMPPEQHAAHAAVTALVPVTLVNTDSDALSYSLDEFRLVTGDGELAPSSEQPDATVRTLRPGAAITMRLSFTTTSVDSARLRYTPAEGGPVEVPLAGAPGAAGTHGDGADEESGGHDDSQPHEHAHDTAKDH